MPSKLFFFPNKKKLSYTNAGTTGEKKKQDTKGKTNDTGKRRREETKLG